MWQRTGPVCSGRAPGPSSSRPPRWCPRRAAPPLTSLWRAALSPDGHRGADAEGGTAPGSEVRGPLRRGRRSPAREPGTPSVLPLRHRARPRRRAGRRALPIPPRPSPAAPWPPPASKPRHKRTRARDRARPRGPEPAVNVCATARNGRVVTEVLPEEGEVAKLPYDVEPGRRSVEPGSSHVVHIRADARSVASRIAAYTIDGLRAGQGVVLFAEPARVADVREALAREGVDLDRDRGISVHDAGAALEELMAKGRPDARGFSRVVGRAVGAAAERRGGVRAYEEMGDILLHAGDRLSALALEELWAPLACELPVSLYCAYCCDLFARKARPGGAEAADHERGSRAGTAPGGTLDELCRLHSAVVADRPFERRASALARFGPDVTAPSAARAFVLRELTPGADPDVAAAAALAVSELATNALRHTGGSFTVAVTPLSGSVRIAVDDCSPDPPVPGRPGLEERSGRGLEIVAAVSRQWGTRMRCDGKLVWAEVELPRSAPPPRGTAPEGRDRASPGADNLSSLSASRTVAAPAGADREAADGGVAAD